MKLVFFYGLIWEAALVSVASYTLLRGGRDERLSALAIVLGDIAAIIHHYLPHPKHVDAMNVMLDGGLLAFFMYRAAITTRWWPLYACAAQLAVCCGLAAAAAHLPAADRTYKDFAAIWGYGLLLSLALGTLLERDRICEDQVLIRARAS